MKTAIVIGAGVVGRLAVAAKHSERVVLIKKDDVPDEAIPRKAVPQGNHVHAMLESGEPFLSHLFPGSREKVLAAGCLEPWVRSQWRSYTPTDWSAKGSRWRPIGVILRRLWPEREIPHRYQISSREIARGPVPAH